MKDDFDGLIRAFRTAPDKLSREVMQKSLTLAEKVAGRARDGAPVNQGRLRNSIMSYTQADGDVIEGGARTDYAPAIYQEFGTGPVGAESGYPDSNMTITYRPDGWVYQSEEVARMRGEEYVPNESGGYVYTRGVPAKAFMYNAITSMEDQILSQLGEAALEVFAKK